MTSPEEIDRLADHVRSEILSYVQAYTDGYYDEDNKEVIFLPLEKAKAVREGARQAAHIVSGV